MIHIVRIIYRRISLQRNNYSETYEKLKTKIQMVEVKFKLPVTTRKRISNFT